MGTHEYRRLRELRLWDRFHVKLTALYGVASLVALGAMSWSFYRTGLDAELDGLRTRLLAMAVSLAQTLDAEMLAELGSDDDEGREEYQRLFRSFEAIIEEFPKVTAIYVMGPTEEPGMLRVFIDVTPEDPDPASPGAVYDARDLPVMRLGLTEPAVEEEPWPDEYGLTLSGYAPIRLGDGTPLGLVGVDVDAESVALLRSRMLRTTLLLFGVVAAFLGLIGWWVGRSLRQPLSRVLFAADAVAAGDLKARAGLERRDEFGLLGRRFDEMTHGLGERELLRETFGRYVNREVAEELLASGGVELGGEEREVTVMLTDLEGYSTISETASPSDVVALLNQYLGAMNQLIDAHRGCVIEYTGDGILAVFGAPNPLPDHAEQAVRCAVALRARLDKLNREWDETGRAQMWRKLGLERLRMRIGLHLGRVVAGNLGSETRVKYSIIGDTVNVAARLEQLNKTLGTNIVMSNAVRDALGEELSAQVVGRGSHLVKGRSEAIETWSI
jgi:adenylate cyclase